MDIKYIDSSFLYFFDYAETEHSVDEAKFYRAYEIWDHCKELLESGNSSLIRIDVISNLRRCLNQRLKNIENYYFINSLPFLKNDKRYFDKLSSLNIIRPFMLQQLFEICNDIEHNDAKPPSAKRTQELLDISWYFLKSTDQLVRGIRDDFLFNFRIKKSTVDYGVTLKFNLSNRWEINIRGWIPKNFVKNFNKKNTIPVEILEFGTKFETNVAKYHEDKLDTDLFIEGIFKPDNQMFKEIVLVYFNV